MYTKEEYENLINSSSLFDVDKECNPTLYEREKYEFFTLLTEYYCKYIFINKPLDEYGFTLTMTATECLKYYDKSKGLFLHLFNNALKRDLRIASAKTMIDNYRQGIKLSAYDETMICKVMSFANSKSLDIYDQEVQNKIAIIFGLSVERVSELIFMNDNAVAVGSTMSKDDGDEVELFDLVLDKNSNIEEKVVAESSFVDILDKIQNIFQGIQARQKQLLSALLTIEIVKALDFDLISSEKYLCEFEFFNRDILKWCKQNNDTPTAKAIGEQFGLSEQSISRTYRNFKEKLKQNC